MGWMRVALALTGAGLAAGRAYAGAWTPQKGTGLEISTLSRETGDFGDTWQGDYYLEYGAGERWSYHLKIDSQQRESSLYSDRTALEAGVRRVLVKGQSFVMSAQGTLVGADSVMAEGCSGVGVELRLAGGVSSGGEAISAFANVEGARRWRDAYCEQWIGEVAAGVRIGANWTVIAKSWAETGRQESSAKGEVLVMRRAGEYDIGAGWRSTLSGRYEEEGLVLTAWRRF